ALVESRQHAWLALSKHPDHDGIANSFARTVIRSGKFWALSNDPKRRRETMDFALRSLVKCIRARGKDDLLVKPKSTLSRAQLLGMIGEDPAAAREYAHEALARAEVHDVPRKQEYELALMEIEQRRRIGQLAEEVGDLVDRNLEPRLRDIQRDSLQLLGLLATVVALVAATAGFAANAMTAKQIDGGLAAEVAMSLAGAIAVGFGTLFVATSRDRHGLLAAVSVVLGGLLLISTAAGRVSPQPKDLRLLPLATGAYVLYKLAGSVKHAFSIEQWRGFGMWIWILRFGGVLALTWFFSTFGAPRSW
ncbi:MAG: hypothetical protein JWM86_719, partial [Thermoleophilia bacterium]|nr:hypothetical protein [Thermoleophilia bacterium]